MMDSSNTTLYPESPNTSRDSLGGGISVGGSSIPATTIATIVVQNGPLQMTVALLQSGELYHIKVIEVEPQLTTLGDNIDEAVGMQREHDEMLRQLQDKSTPVEEFVRKADKLLGQRKAPAQVLDAMGHTLNLAWEDILKLVHDRKHLLDLCANFHEKMGSCRGKMAALEVACKDTMIPIEVDAVQEFLGKFKQLRIDVLTAVMCSLKDGNDLLARLQEIAQPGTLDSRPDQIRRDALRTINQVQQWLEVLHDRRNNLEAAWQTRKTQLEQCLALAMLAKELDELESTLLNRRNDLFGAFSLGECEHTANASFQEYVGFKQDALQLRDRAIKITRATEKLVSGGCFAGDEACTRAYSVLNSSTELFEITDQREHWLRQSKDFFSKAEKTLSVLERLEIELSTVKIAHDTPEAFAMFAKILKDVGGFTEEPLRIGYGILDEVGRTKPETQGIKRVLEEIENRKIYIEGFCSSSSEQQVKVTKALQEFMDKYTEILSWLVSIAEAFLQTNDTLGDSLPPARAFLHLHHKLMQDLEVKGENINELLIYIKNFLNSLDAQQRYEVDSKAESLHKHWIELKEIVIKRVDLVSMFIEFLEKAEKLNEMFDFLDENLKQTPENEKLKQLESTWAEIQPTYGNLKTLGIRFLNIKVADPYLETKSACSSVQEILNSFSNRQFDITTSWEKWTTSITEKREIQIFLEKIMNEQIEILNSTTKFDAEIYPVLTSEAEDPQFLKDHVQHKLNNVPKDLQRAQDDIIQKITTTAGIQTKDQETMEKVTLVINNLRSMKDRLDNIKYDYQSLLEDIISFLDNVISTRSTIEEYFLRKQTTSIDRENINRDLAEQEVFRENVMDKFRSLISHSEKLIERVRVLEPAGAREHDTDRILTLLEKLRIYFESNNDQRMSQLQKLQTVSNFDRELNEIRSNIESVNSQLSEIKRQYGESSASAKATSLAFEYFERTIELLEKRIENFINSSENTYTTNPDTEPYVRSEIEKLRKQWEDLKSQVKSTRHSINLANDYYVLLDKVETEYRAVSTFYTNTANQIPYLRSPVEASNLINNIERYTSEHEGPQMEDIKKLSQLSYEIFNHDKASSVRSDNITLFQSFIRLKADLSVVEERLRGEEKLRELEQIQRQKELEQMSKLREQEEIQKKKHQEEMQKQKELEDQQRQKLIEELERQKQSEILQIQQRLEQQLKDAQQRESTQKNITEVHEKKEVTEFMTAIHYASPRFVRPLKDATIKEGDKFTFECEVTGNPEPSIEWFKDGISIQSNSDYRTTYNKGVCTLSIEETFAADSAKFMCRASNSVGIAETISVLSVKEQAVDEQMIPPKILKYLQNGIAREGSSFQFSCIVSGSPLPTVQWFKNDKCIDDSRDYIITYNNGEAILRFEEVFLEDHAVYTCKASNPAGSEQCFANLSVEPLEPTEVPKFTVPLSNVMARVGQKIKLECVVTGLPRPEIYWTHNGKQFTSRDAKYEDDRVTLIIPEAYPKDAGLYVTTAKNLAGEAYSACNVSVKGRLPNETSDSEMASDLEPIKPSVQLPLKDVSIFEGKSVRLDCIIIGQPEPEVIWYHNERPVKESTDVQLLFQGDRCSLVIQEAYLEDAGKYKVVAINSAGEASNSCNFTVTPLNIAEPATRTQSERILSTESPPKFEKFLTDVLAAEGDTVELECCVIGDPKPTAKWYLINRELYETDRIRITSGEGGIYKLTIRNVSSDDKGLYTIKASNKSGDAKCFSHLIVKSVNAPDSNQHLQMEIDEKLVCPTFKELFSDKTAHQGEVVKFECIVSGKPTPKIKWYFNDQPVHGKHFLVSTSGDRQVLTVPEAGPENVGKIACVAENEIGKATCVAHLNLIGDGVQPDSNFEVHNLNQDFNTESSRVTIKKQMFTTTSTSQISSSENGIPQTQIHGNISSMDHSFNQFGQQKPFETRQYQEYQKMHETPVEIQQKSTITVSKPFELDTHHRTGRKTIAPRFITPLVGKIVDQGANIVLEAVYDGYPSPEIKVQKNGEDLISNERLKINNQFNKVTIELQNVGVRDAGRYSITAVNPSGQSTSTADVVVKKTIFPPVFGHRLQAQVAKRGERVVMEVEVTGTPDPTVTWYKDNRPLNEAMISEYKVRSEGNGHTLIIDKVKVQDSGKYMVKAVNAGGEAQSIADFAVLEPTPERMVEVVKTVVYDDLKDFKDQPSKPHSTSFHSTNQESSTSSDLHGTSESKIVTEHRCTTAATMRMEHKSILDLDLELPKLQFPSQKQFTHSTTSTSAETNQMKTDDFTQTPPQVPPKPHFEMPKSLFDTTDNSGIETSSITKKSAFEYFKKIQSSPIPTTTLTPSEEKYTKFEETKTTSTTPTPKFNQQFPAQPPAPPPSHTSFGPSFQDLNLIPGSPPEIGYIPKIETPHRENISERIKKLEESHKSNVEAPSGGVSVFPDLSTHRQEYSSSFMKETKFESSGPIFRPQAALTTPLLTSERSPSPKPSAEGVAMEKLWASPKPYDQETPGQEPSYQKIPYESEPDYPLPEPPKSIKDTTKIFEEQIKKMEAFNTYQSELKAPSLVKQTLPQPPPVPEKPKPIEPSFSDLNLVPGPPPEICFAPKSTEERRPSLVESIEEALEKNLSREPSKVLPCSVRMMPPIKIDAPPPLPPKDFHVTAPPVPTKPDKPLEPFPYMAPPEVPRKPKPPPPAVPSKFIQADFSGSEQELNRWKYSGSESETEPIRPPPMRPPTFVPRPPSVEAPPRPPSVPMEPKPIPVSGYTADSEESMFRKFESRSVQESKQFFETHSTQHQDNYAPARHFKHHVHQSAFRQEFPQPDQKAYSNASMVKNISITTKQMKVNEQPNLEPFPYKPDPPKPRGIKVPPPPSPSKFVKGEFRESDYGSDYDERIHPIWRPSDSDSDVKGYRPIRPVLTPTGRRSTMSDEGRSPAPPSEFDIPPKFEGPPRPKFEPIKHEEPVKTQPQTHVFKPKAVSGKPAPPVAQSTPRQPAYTTQYYQAIAGTPFHHASMATETRNVMHMKESSESSHRVVNMSQTRRIIQFDKEKSSQEIPLEPFPYTPSPTSMSSPRPRVPAHTPTPTKFVPGEFRESTYDSEIENARIRAIWSPYPRGDPRFRHVDAPRSSRSSSLPRSYERVVTPMEFDSANPEMPSKIPLTSPTYYTTPSYKSKTIDQRYTKTHTIKTTRDDMNLQVGSPPKYGYVPEQARHRVKDFSSSMQQKSSQFIKDVSSDLKTTHSFRPGFKRAPSEGDNRPQAYRQDSRVSQYGTKHIDPDTGLIYFKYDFGYEFGIIFPGEGKKLIGGSHNSSKSFKDSAIRNCPANSLAGDIIIPVHHERSTTPRSGIGMKSFKDPPASAIRKYPGTTMAGDIIIPVQHERTSTPRQNGFTSESEFSETEYDSHAKKRYSLPNELYIDGFHPNYSRNYIVTSPAVSDYNPSPVPINAQNREDRPKRPPIFITPLKDIAVVIGQTARFECIVQCDPHPEITWCKNGFPLETSNKHVIEFRNGVCRLTIPQAFPDDAGTYTCHGANELGASVTTAELLVPGNRCGVRK